MREQIIEYATKMFEQLEEAGVSLSEEDKRKIVAPYLEREGTYEEITGELLASTIKFKEAHEQKILELSEPIEPLEFYDLPIFYKGLTLNEQDIDLLNIVGAQTPEDLIRVAKTLANIPTNLTDVTYENLEEQKRALFARYQAYLIPKNTYFQDKSINLRTKLDKLFKSGMLTEEEITTIQTVIATSKNHQEIVNKLKENFPQSKVTKMIKFLREIVPIEKSGIKSSSYEAYVNLYNMLPRFNSVTLDDQFKYGSIVLQDGTQVYHHFEKGLRFAQEHHMQVRGNSLISYMACPDWIYEAEPSKEMHDIAYKELDNYIKGMFTLLERPEYQGRVRSIDIFNELLNRSGSEYVFRGEAPQDVPPEKLDDYKSGWFKHLTLQDIFKLIATNKKLLQNQTIDFMYNEVFLEDPKKMAAFHKIMSEIKKFEQESGVQIIDTLGIQLHTDYNITREQLIQMFREMGKYGYPIEITEFDMTIPEMEVVGLTNEQIEVLRQRKINEIMQTIYSIRKEVNIKGFTIWSLNDQHNFVVSLANEQRIPAGKEPVETLHGGYFTEEMTPRGEAAQKAFEPTNPELEVDRKKVLTYPTDNSGFANIFIIAMVVGGFLGILVAFAVLNIK